MAKRLVDKVLGFMGFEDDIVEEDEEKEAGKNYREEEETHQSFRKGKGQVVSLHTQRQVKVVVVEPRFFEEVQGIADNLKNRRPVIVNLERADAELAKRVVDFVSGATYALNGSMQKVGQGIFLFVPSNVDIHNEVREQLEEKSLFGWLK